MTNIFKDRNKLGTKQRLFEIGLKTLEADGYSISRVRGAGSSVRRVTKSGKSQIVTIRTSQNQWFAFPRSLDDKGWKTLDDADLVVVVTIDDSRTQGIPFIFPADEVRKRFDQLYRARLDAGHSVPLGRGVWLALFYPEDGNTAPIYTAAGLGTEKAYKRPNVALGFTASTDEPNEDDMDDADTVEATPAALPSNPSDDGPLTIPEAKRRLALTFGVDPSAIKITVEG